jgi:hypothetical protein
VGRHGGRSDGRLEGAIDAPQGPVGTRTNGRVDVGTTTLAPAPGGTDARWWEDVPQPSRAVVADPWWDEAPVPPPVVVASADGRTPAVTFAPDADPFSAGGLFAPAGPRDGEPLVVVHPAPDAAVQRAVRRSRRGSSVTLSVADTSGLRAFDAVLDTGSLVRPYVPDVEMADPIADPAAETVAAPWAGPVSSPDTGDDAEAVGAGPAPLRRARRLGGPLDRIVEAAPAVPAVPAPARPVTEWSAPWSRDPQGEAAERSLFEPVVRREHDGLWAAPDEQGPPSRKALRAKERAADEVAALPGVSGRELAGRTAGRRLAKSGVLAVTAMGVVAASAPNAFTAMGWRLPAHQGGSGAQAALVELSTPAVLAGSSLSAPGGDLAVAMRDVTSQRRAEAAAAAKAGAVAAGAGRTLVDVARQQVKAEAARKQAIADRVSRNVVRDPRAYARMLVQQRGWSDSQFTCLNLLWNRESGWNYRAQNPSSGAYGIPQSLPGSKMASIASDWRTNPATQIKWGLKYIADRYGTPCGAWAHSESHGWY